MRVRKPGASRPSWRRLGEDVTAVGILAAGFSGPALVVPGYASVVSTLVVLAVVGGGVRLLFGAAVALPECRAQSRAVEPPAELPPASVIVTAYDEAGVLAETLAACRALAYPADRLEIVVVYEAASTDGTAAIAEVAARTDPRVVAVARRDPPGGKAAATNAGLARATGEAVAVVDADQRLAPDALRRAVTHLETEGVRCVTGRRYGYNPSESLVALYATVEHHLAERVEFVARDRLGGFSVFTGGQAFFEATLFDDGRFDETVLLEDLALAWRLQSDGGTVRVDPGLLSYERNPTTLRALWSQRVRWARGGMQVARAWFETLRGDTDLSRRGSIDAAATFGALLALPMLVLAVPSVLVGLAGIPVAPLLPDWWPAALGVLGFGGPFAAFVGVVTTDHRQGRDHAPREFVAAATLPLFWALQSLAVLRAFMDEFVFDRPTVYVTS